MRNLQSAPTRHLLHERQPLAPSQIHADNGGPAPKRTRRSEGQSSSSSEPIDQPLARPRTRSGSAAPASHAEPTPPALLPVPPLASCPAPQSATSAPLPGMQPASRLNPLAPRAPSAPSFALKRPLRNSSAHIASTDGRCRAVASGIVAEAESLPLATTAVRPPDGVECRLLPPPAPVVAGDFTLAEARAIRLYRQRLPGCNVDLQDACSPCHPGLTPRRRSVDGDFLQLLVHGSGARTAVACVAPRREGGLDEEAVPVGACTFIPHPDAHLCELQLLAVTPRYAGRGIGSALLAAVEQWLQASGIRMVVALAGLDTVDFWRKCGYDDVRIASTDGTTDRKASRSQGNRLQTKAAGRSTAMAVTSGQWALVRDPFGSSKAMIKSI